MPWYYFVKMLPCGQREVLARLDCANDAQATDDLSAAMYPEAQVWEGRRYVATLPPLGAGEQDLTDQTVRFEPVRMGDNNGSGLAFDAGATLRRRPTG